MLGIKLVRIVYIPGIVATLLFMLCLRNWRRASVFSELIEQMGQIVTECLTVDGGTSVVLVQQAQVWILSAVNSVGTNRTLL